jgi:diguanylate cyclase (GGDEF)-like protein
MRILVIGPKDFTARLKRALPEGRFTLTAVRALASEPGDAQVEGVDAAIIAVPDRTDAAAKLAVTRLRQEAIPVLALFEPGRAAVAAELVQAGATQTLPDPMRDDERKLLAANLEAVARRSRREDLERGDYQRLKRYFPVLAGMSHLFHSCPTEQEVLDVIEFYLPSLFAEAACALYLRRDESGELHRFIASGPEFRGPEEVPAAGCEAVRTRMPKTSEDCHAAGCSLGRYFAGLPTLCLPLVAGGEDIGLLIFHATTAASNLATEFTRNLGVAVVAAENIALALYSVKLCEELYRQSTRDPLTGLFNRRYLRESLKRELFNHERRHRPLGMLVIDIDNFKTFNDDHGHDAGDEVIRRVARALQNFVRSGDIPCRYGGEEFLVVMNTINVQDCASRAEQLRKRIEKLEARFEGRDLGQVRVSIGVAVYPDHGETPDELIKAADKALYAAKKAGRNVVKVAND